ncbi:MAG: hypothetical protein KF746_22410 [Chitinophagaceae bacterium]|nr:hypothetical protein [Chitinophagaceae bacterium]
MKIITCLSIILFISGCTPPLKTVHYKKPADEMQFDKSLSDFVKETPSPKIVLRIEKELDKYEYINIYNYIEKALMKNGFIVRDRKLFNEIFNRSAITNYTQISSFTDTDLILEITGINPAVSYETNAVILAYPKKQKTKFQNIQYRKYGANISYKLILVGANTLGGIVQHHYAPCPEGCDTESYTFKKKKDKETTIGNAVSAEELEEFITISINKMLNKLKAGN